MMVDLVTFQDGGRREMGVVIQEQWQFSWPIYKNYILNFPYISDHLQEGRNWLDVNFMKYSKTKSKIYINALVSITMELLYNI